MASSDQQDRERASENELHDYKLIKWKTLRSASSENFQQLLAREENRSTFDKSYITSVAERWRELQRTQYRFSALLFFLILFMGAINSEDIQELSLFGMKISADGPAIGALLLFTSILMFFVTVVSSASDSYEGVIRSYIEVNHSEDVSKLYLFRFGWSTANNFGNTHHYSYQILEKLAILFSFVFILGGAIVAATLLVVLQFYLYISAIISVQAESQLPEILSVPIVVVASCAAVFSICSYISRIPLPYWDYSNFKKLTELEKEDPERAKQIWTIIGESDLARERRNVGILQLLTVMLAAIVPQVTLSGATFFSEYYMLVPLLTIPVIVFALIAPMLDAYERWSFRQHSSGEGAGVPLVGYRSWKRKILARRLVVCFVVGICLFIAFEFRG